MATSAKSAPSTPARAAKLRREASFGWLMVSPALLIFSAFVLFPILVGLPLAFFEVTIRRAGVDLDWVGLSHFRRLAGDANFWSAMWHSLLYLLVVPPLQLFSIVLAVLLNQKLPGTVVFRTMYYIPVVTSIVAVGITWRLIYQDRGLVNGLLASLGVIHPLDPIGFLSDPNVALWAVMSVTLWKGIGYYMVIYLAGLQGIPKELTEAARIDGAGYAQSVWFVTIPLLRPFVLLCSLLSTIAALRVFDEVWVMTKGGPVGSTSVANTYLYRTGFEQVQYGYAAAVGLAIGVVVLIVSVAVFIFNRRGGVRAY